MTRLANRSTLFKHIEHALATIGRRSTDLFAVLLIDFDQLRELTDESGPIAAERVLEVTAKRLERCVRSGDIVARIGVDQFAILANGIRDIAGANDAAHRIRAEVQRPMSIDTHVLRTTARIAITLGSARYDRPEDMLRDADVALSAATTGGPRSTVDPKVSVASSQRQWDDLESDLNCAIERKELRIAYQPVICLANDSIVGFEALVRWQHPRLGLLQPQDFIAWAEASDMIIAIDRWVLREACRTLAAWQSVFARTDLTMSVNVSSKDFSHSAVLDELRDVLTATGVPPQCLHLEITERTIMARSDRATALFDAIIALGVELQLDDFGVGYSSLSTFAHIPVCKLKIDRAFVEVIKSPKGAEVIRTIVHLAHNLGLATIAEGVESLDQRDELIAMKCDYGQGFLFSKPLDANSVEELLRATVHQ